MAQSLFSDRAALAELCRKHHIRKLSLFGSVLKGTAGRDSDVDLLVEFEAGWTGVCKIRDASGLTLATVTETGPGTGVDGTLTFSTGKVALNLPATFTAGLSPTTAYRPGPSKSFVYADVSLTDPTDDQPYILGRGKGVIYLPTTVGP